MHTAHRTPHTETGDSRLILALDVDSFEKAIYFVELLYPKIKIFKVGSQLFTGCGPKIIEFIHKKGGEVFLDLKFHDIPNTVANAVSQACRLKVKMLTLHISGTEEMLKAAVKAAKESALGIKHNRPLLIGVTVLTSQEAGRDEVLRLARMGLASGLDGVVCSAREVEFLREELGEDFVIVTPGIRPKEKGADDQRRVATAQEAIAAGSSFLVVGRPVLEAKDPLRAVRDIWN